MTEEKGKVLILVPALTARGGITNYYHVLKEEFPSNIEYFERGSRTWPIRKSFLQELIRAYRDYRNFKKRIKRKDISLVQSTTSLGLSTTLRDGLFLKYTQMKGIKTIVFFRGWDYEAEKKNQKFYLKLFKYFFFRADAFIVLSSHSKSVLNKWGYKRKIYIETTVVDKNLIKGISENYIKEKFDDIQKSGKINFLFLSRIEKSKGIYELIEAFEELKNISKYDLSLTICGDGFELEPIRQKVNLEQIEGVEIKGFVEGVDKRQAFLRAQIFVFPSHGEGMPNAVLEAMGFGLPVITTPVGGVVDFFKEGQNGFYTPIRNSQLLTKNIQKLIEDTEVMLPIAKTNYRTAFERFSSEKVASRILSIFCEVINSTSK